MQGIKAKLADLRTEIGAIAKNKENPFFNSEYFDINELLNQLQPHLDERGLLLTQPIIGGNVTTVIEDVESGEARESELPLPNLDDPQKMGSAITYYRRYTLQSLLALQAEDDDGNKASGKTDDDDKPWLNETDEEPWMKAEKYVKEGGNPTNLRKKYKVSKKNMQYFKTLHKEAGH